MNQDYTNINFNQKQGITSGEVMKWVGMLFALVPPLVMAINIVYGTNIDTEKIERVMGIWIKFVSTPEFLMVGGVGIAGKVGAIRQ